MFNKKEKLEEKIQRVAKDINSLLIQNELAMLPKLTITENGIIPTIGFVEAHKKGNIIIPKQELIKHGGVGGAGGVW